ncbi:MAG: hypothetical protein ABIQ11_01690 [Saprospiraceae bacterium]
MFKSSLIIFFLTFLSGFAFAQATVYGVIVDEVTGEALPNVEIRSLFPDKTLTNAEGHFSIRHRADQIDTLFINFNLSEFTGSVRIGFRCVGSGPGGQTSTFRIDNVKVENL